MLAGYVEFAEETVWQQHELDVQSQSDYWQTCLMCDKAAFCQKQSPGQHTCDCILGQTCQTCGMSQGRKLVTYGVQCRVCMWETGLLKAAMTLQLVIAVQFCGLPILRRLTFWSACC